MYLICLITILLIGCVVFYFTVYSAHYGGSNGIASVTEGFRGSRKKVKNPTSYILWTGDYPSTFRVMQSVVDENRVVVPIYVLEPKDYMHEGEHRPIQQELESIRAISRQFYKDHPELGRNLKPLITIPSPVPTKNIQGHMETLHQKGHVRHPRCKYSYLAQTAEDLGHPVELPINKEPEAGTLYKSIVSHVDGMGPKRRLTRNAVQTHPELAAYSGFTFPTMDLTKHDMGRIAEAGHYDEYLDMTTPY